MGHEKLTCMTHVRRALTNVGAGTPKEYFAMMDADNFWWYREAARHTQGIYKPLPRKVENKLSQWGAYIPTNHYIHLSVEHPGLIAYTPDEEYGKADRQVRAKFGKYLTKMNTDHWNEALPAPIIAELASMLRNLMCPPELHFARTQEEIAHVFDVGPRSCMGAGGREFCAEVAPVRVYASDDCGVAYTMRGDEIVSRTVVRFDSQQYIQIYGDEFALKEALTDAGWTYGNTLEGCRLAYVLHDGCEVMPYLDGDCQYVTQKRDDNGLYWLVDEGGEHRAESVMGYIDEPEMDSCEDCETRVPSENICHIDYDDRYVCRGCREDHYVSAYTGGSYVELIHEENHDLVGTFEGNFYTQAGLDRANLVRIDDEIYSVDDTVKDHFHGERILTEDAVEFTLPDGMAAFADGDERLVFSQPHDSLILLDDAVQGPDGAWTYSNQEEILNDGVSSQAI